MKSLIEASRIPVVRAAAPVVYDNVNDLPFALRRTMVHMIANLEADEAAGGSDA